MAEPTHEWLCQQIVDNTGDAIIVGDAEGKVRLWNTGAEKIFGFRADEIVGNSMDLIIPENLRERHWEGYDQTMKTGRTQYSRNLLAVPAIRKDGARISIEFTITLIRNDDGKLLGPAAILREVTARWNQDKDRRKRLAALEAEITSLPVLRNLLRRGENHHGSKDAELASGNMAAQDRNVVHQLQALEEGIVLLTTAIG
jgi:PAS domain S-box-containing protein